MLAFKNNSNDSEALKDKARQLRIDIVKSITQEQILDTAKKVFGAARRGFVLIGPKARRKRDLVEKLLSIFDNIGE